MWTRTGTLVQSVVISVLEKECVECEKRAVSQLEYPALVGSWQLRGGWGPLAGWPGLAVTRLVRGGRDTTHS